MSGRWVSVSVASVAALLLSACASESGSTEAETSVTSTTTEVTTESVTEAAETTVAVPEEESDQAKYIRTLEENNIEFRGGFGYSSTYSVDERMCEGMRKGETSSYDLASLERVRIDGDDNGDRIKLMVPILCPDQQAVLDEAVSGYPVQQKVVAGSAVVADMREQGGPVAIQPGTWRTEDSTVSDCYWERGDANGNIIDNNFITFAPGVTVTIAPTDGTFVSRGCGSYWVRVQ